MKYLKYFKLFEAYGVAEATLIYNQFLLDEFNKYFDIAKESGDKNYSHTQDYSQEDLAQFIKNPLWVKYPISSLSVTYTIETLKDNEFNSRFFGIKKNHTCTGACYNIGVEDGSAIKPAIDDRSDITLHLVLEIGAIISESFSDREALSIEIESSITHELNHGYEGWNRMKKGKGQISTDVTFALDVNRSKIKKDIWDIWYNEVGFFVYWSEQHEINAMVQDSFPYVKKYDFDEMKSKTPSWRFSTKMKDFNAQEFKQKMINKILSTYPDANVEIFLKRMQNALANELIKLREESINRKEDRPTLSGEFIRKLSVDEFLSFIEKRINRAGERIQRKIIRMYSFKDKY